MTEVLWIVDQMTCCDPVFLKFMMISGIPPVVSYPVQPFVSECHCCSPTHAWAMHIASLPSAVHILVTRQPVTDAYVVQQPRQCPERNAETVGTAKSSKLSATSQMGFEIKKYAMDPLPP